ncbi:MAG: AmmeMemoRadiSam system radical SAM enzyme [Armatimonadetes bacterium]|nr:AmmeMemoRadiSam system radical SAM enzyme [Armatimonadota bacterium]
MDRREALRLMGCGLAAGAALGALPSCANAAGYMSEARYYDKLAGLKVRCQLCPKQCVVGDRERGFCGVRENRGGKYYTLVYGQCAALNLDPIEKKPLFHFLPGSGAFSIAAAGCNFDCKDCQNWEISQARPEQITSATRMLPNDVAAGAKRYGAESIAYTYSEPVVFYEYMLDSAQAGHRVGVRSVMISNGYIRPDPMKALLPHLDAVKIDLKSISEKFYKDYCVGELAPVLETIKLVKRSGKWLELVYLVVPTLNDSDATVREMCQWVRANVGAEVPLHFSRFYPNYQLKKLPPTPYETMERCWKLAREAGMSFVYVGNVPDTPHVNTICPGCGKAVIKRSGYAILERNLRNGTCRFCARKIPGVWA